MKTLSSSTYLNPLCFRSLLAISLGFLVPSHVDASLHSLDLTTGGAAGSDLDAGIAHVVGGLTLTATANGGAVNATAASLGVNVVGNGADVSDQIDFAFAEDLTFTLTFGGALNVSLVSLDLVGVGPSAGDQAYVYINANPAVILQTGAANFNGTTDVWTPAGGISLASGDTIRFAAGNTFGLQGIAFDVTAAVPEPVSLLVWTVGIAGCLCRRRSR